MVLDGKLSVTWAFSENSHRRETIAGLAESFIQYLRELIAHCNVDAGGFTPSDFPLAQLDEEELLRVSTVLNN